MKALLYYLVQVIFTSGILYAWYHFALRNKRFHRYNRFYLLAAAVISILIPFLNIPVYFSEQQTDSSFILQTLTVISSSGGNDIVASRQVAPVTHTNWFTLQNILYLFYCLIVFAALFRIFYSLRKINKIIRNNPVEKLDKIHFVNTEEPGTPFSFFRWLFWNKKIELQSEKGGQIFRHELFHIEQKHSLDILYMELLTALCWLNPFYHLMKREVKAIHEFLADQFAVTENTKWQYAELLLMQAMNTNQRLVNPFFHNQIKRRVVMITTSKKTSYQYLRKLMVFPVAAIVIALFAFSYKEKKNSSKDDMKNNSMPHEMTDLDTSKPVKIVEVTLKDSSKENKDFYTHAPVYVDGVLQPGWTYQDIDKKMNPKDIKLIDVLKGPAAIAKYGTKGENGVIDVITINNKTIKITEVILTDTQSNPTDNKIFDKVEIEPSFPGGDAIWRQYLMRNLDASVPVNKKAPAGTYTVIVQFIVDKEGNISDVKALTKHGYGMEEEAIRVIKSGPKWQPAMQNGHEVKAYRKQPITFSVGKEQKNFSANDKVETPPSFPGGESAWKKYLIQTINASLPVDSGAPAGIYKVIVQFIVHEDGSLSDLKAKTKHGYGMENEAMRIVKIGPKWIPARQNGYVVNAYVQQPVTFAVTEEIENEKNNPSIPKISIEELKMASVYQLLQVKEGSEIISFTFTMNDEEGNVHVVQNIGNSFNPPIQKLISNAKAGRILTIDVIKIKEQGVEKKIPARIYSISN